MKKTIAAAVAACALAACAPAEDTAEAVVGQSGVNLRADILADTDVAGMGYAITAVDCDTGEAIGEPIAAAHDLEDLLLPGGHPGFENQPFDAASGHLFADHFQALEPGCYDVVAQPLDAEGQPSDHCAPASAAAVPVVAEQVTEIMLVSQCVGDAIGALDVIAALNHAPEIVDITYDPSKFTCGGETTLCVTARDPDGDPLQLVANAEDGVELTLGRPARAEDGSTTTQCVTVRTPAPGEYAIDLAVYDLMRDADGNPVTVESLLAEGQTSHARISAPVHAMDAEACICACPEGFALNATGDACERQVEQDAIFNGAELTVCEGDDRNEYGALGAIFPDGLIVQNDFFGLDFDTPQGRLNEVGIWSCEGALREWIGFSFCLTIEEPGEYVIGTAGDDNTRIVLDGQVLLHNNGQNAFRHWWMVPVRLDAGSYVFELEGYDVGIAATLGAEIYGPFPEGSTADDASLAGLDYANSIVWSTGDQLGGVFHTGDNSGYSCPDGTSLNLCGEAPSCTGTQVAACQ